MINRIVKMTFKPIHTATFESLFESKKDKIVSFPGCHGVSLLRDALDPRIYLTYSFWDSAEALEAYRQSELFKETWQETKAMFDDKPSAWSTNVISSTMNF